jgi:Dihydrodipicolinate reductase, N-terminus
VRLRVLRLLPSNGGPFMMRIHDENQCCRGHGMGWQRSGTCCPRLARFELGLRCQQIGCGAGSGSAWGGEAIGIPVMSSVTEAVRHADVFVDYTSHEAVRAHVLTAIDCGVAGWRW